MDDVQLLSQFAAQGDLSPLAHLVGVYVHLVHSVSTRQLQDPALADQSTQATFVLLARQAQKLTRQTTLAPWLYTTAYDCATRLKNAPPTPSPGTPREGRAEGPSFPTATRSDWQKIAPEIDSAIISLSPTARDAIILKYILNLSLRDVATLLGCPDTVAGQEIASGTARVRLYLESRNIPISPDALVAAIQSKALAPAPQHIAQNAMLAIAAPPDQPLAARTLAGAVAGKRRASLMLGYALNIILLISASILAFKLFDRLRAAQLAATQPTTAPAPDSPDSPTPSNPAPQTIPKNTKPLPAAQPIRPVDPNLAQLFLRAIRESDFDAVQQLFDRDTAVVNIKDPKSGLSAIQVAADRVLWKNGDATKIARFLIDNGAVTDIHTAARAGYADYVLILISLNPSLLNQTAAQPISATVPTNLVSATSAPAPVMLTPIQSAALIPGVSPDCEAVVDLLIRFGAQIDIYTAATFGRRAELENALADDPSLLEKPCLGATPLNWAARPRRYTDQPLAIAQFLIDKGADVFSRDTQSDGMTPLHHVAAWGDQTPLAQLLLDHKVDINIEDDFGWTPLDYAIDRDHRQMAAFLQSKGAKRTTTDYPDQPSKTLRFFTTVKQGDTEGVKRLLDDTPELAKTRGPTGETPMHHAAAIGSIPIIDLLLADHADINAEESNKFGGSPLFWAIRNNQFQTADYLLSKSADPKQINHRTNQTLLHAAAHANNLEFVKKLLTLGLNPATKDRHGKLARDYASDPVIINLLTKTP